MISLEERLIGSRAQSYAVSIEHILRDIFGCERFGFGGIVNSDFIRRQPFTGITCGLSYLYAIAKSNEQNEIIKYIDDYYFYSDMSIDTMLSFETSSKEINGINIEISFKDGEELVETMIRDFEKVAKIK